MTHRAPRAGARRDRALDKVMADPRIGATMNGKPAPMDGRRLVRGGLESIAEP